MDLGQRYLGSKGVPAHIVEDGALGNLASPGHREENASHHIPCRPKLGALPLVEGGGCEALSSFRCTWKNATKIIKKQLLRNSSGIIQEHSETLQGISNDS